MSFGLLPSGFVRPRLADIKAQIEADLRATFGEIETGPESVFGQLVGVMSKQLADVWESIEDVHVSFDPDKSEGVSLDNAAQLVAVERLPSTRSTALVLFSGVVGVFIPQATVVTTDDAQATPFETTEPSSISLARISRIIIVVPKSGGSVGAGGASTIRDGAVTFQFPSNPIGFAVGILNLGAWDIEIINDVTESWTIDVKKKDYSPFSIVMGANVLYQALSPGIAVPVRAQTPGPALVLPGTLTQLSSPIAGVADVTNPLEGEIGRNAESDEDLRIRRRRSVRIIGATTVDALRARIFQEIADVRAVVVRENKGIETDADGIPPHSFETVVLGGVSEEIADRIWALKPAGIGTHGNVQVNVADSQGDLQAVFFSRPVEKYVWIDVELTLQEDTALFPAGGETSVAKALEEFGNTLSIGEDVRRQLLFGPIFSVAGIDSATVTLTTTDDPEDTPSGYAAANLDMGAIDIAVFALARIDVTIA